MDDSPAPIRPGGKVEPANRVALVRALFQAPAPPPERYELYDPFAEVTYRSKHIHDIAAKAEHLGASHFSAVAPDGRRTRYEMFAGEWVRSTQHPPRTQHGPDLAHERDDESPPRPAPQAAAPASERAAAPSGEQTAPGQTAAAARSDAEAERAALVARLEAALSERYVIKRATVTVGGKPIGQSEYRYRGDTSRVAFTESVFKLSTDTNNPSVARSMVDVAETRNWQALRVSGHEDFRRMVWIEASLRGVKTIGYEPLPADQELLRKEREARQVNRIEPTADAANPAGTSKGSARGSGSRKTVLAAIEAVLVAQRVPERKRDAIMTAAADNLAKRMAAGEVHKVKVFDKAAPQQRPVVRPTPEPQRVQERAAPVR